MHEDEWQARSAAIVERYEEMLGGGIAIRGNPAVKFLNGVARPINMAGIEAITRAKFVGLLNEAGYYHDRADETAGLMELLGCEVDRMEE